MPTTTSNINLQTTGYTITVGEIIDEFEKAKNRQAKKVVLEKYKDITVLQHPTTIKANYEPVIHCGKIAQTAKIMTVRTARSPVANFPLPVLSEAMALE